MDVSECEKVKYCMIEFNTNDPEVTGVFLSTLVLQAAEITSSAFKILNKKSSHKSNASDLVTEYDQSVESILMATIKAKFSHHRLYCEESHNVNDTLTNDPTWVIDSIDGTTNFIHCIPFTCTSIAFMRNRQVVIGVVHNSILGELFYASRDGPAYLNGKEIQTAGAKKLSDSLLSLSMNCTQLASLYNDNISQQEENKLKLVKKLTLQQLDVILGKVRGVRKLGACALEMCYLAAGRLDILIDTGAKEWDYAAGKLIIECAGGSVTSLFGKPMEVSERNALCLSSAAMIESVIPLVEHWSDYFNC